MFRTTDADGRPSEAAAQTLGSRPIRVLVRAGDGSTRLISVQAESDEDAVRKACARGLQVISIGPAKVARRPFARTAAALRLMQFSQELLTLLEAGLHVTEALAALLAKESRTAAQSILHRLLESMRQGQNFSAALEQYPAIFPNVFVATIRASERTGDLPNSLARYIAYQLQFETVRKRLVAASIYPSLLLIVGACVSLFLLGYVVPRFSVMYDSTGHEMPWLSAKLLAFGRLVHDNGIFASFALATMVLAIGVALSNRVFRARAFDILLRLPWLAEKSARYRSARFLRALSLLLSAGIPLARALTMVDGLLSMSQRDALALLRQRIDEGHSLSAALLSAGLGDPISDSLIKVGERSGQLALMLERAARFHDEEFGRWLDWLSRLIEPLLMIFIGSVVGGIVVLMYMPIFELAGSLQ